MSNPKIADKQPAVLELEAGKYFWCACGQSKNQPFCDGSHAGTEFSPIPFDVMEKKTVFLCQCKQSKNRPYCDGAHKSI